MILVDRPNGLRLFFALRGSILPRIFWSLATCTALASAVSLSHGFLFRWKVTLTPVPFTLIGLALAIFLGFRNTAAYDRYWEARRLWGDVVHRSRSIARQLQTLFQAPSAPPPVRDDARAVMVRRTIAFAHALRHQLRSSDAAPDIERLLGHEEARAFQAATLGTEHLLRGVGRGLGDAMRAGQLDARIAAEIDGNLSGLSAAAAGCERIASTPIPFAYTLLLHRTAYLYCFLLPFGLVDLIGFMTPFVVAIVAYTFFGLDAVGDEIEEPFGMKVHHLPLAAICRTIEINLLEALGEKDLPAAPQAVGSVLH
ncbi:bestrophin family protein [Methylibium sp.]|uniref:bestrophin family protein n=1 Tax=Methylibium sp. TaxID=2067992 RepID=UPI003D14BB5B